MTDEDAEGQHNDQDEENALAPKRANKQVQPPQLKARFRLEEDDEANKEELHFQALPSDQKRGSVTERVMSSSIDQSTS